MSKFPALLLGLCALSLHAEPWNLSSFEASSRQNDPLLLEKKGEEIAARYEAKQLRTKMILPRLRASVALGPAPGISQRIDTLNIGGDSIAQVRQHYDFSSLGPYFGMELEFAQPLNLNRLRLANQALVQKAKVKSGEIDALSAEKSRSYQEAFFQYQYALSMNSLLAEVEKDLNQVRKGLQAKADSGDNEASNQLMEIDAGSFDIEEGQAKVEEGLSRAVRGMKFLLADTNALSLSDSTLSPRSEKLPSLADLKAWTLNNSADLKQLQAGLAAKKALLELKNSELGPEFFLFGGVKFAKSWARDRQGTTGDVFQQDPLNKVEGSLGIGARFDLNLWSKLTDVQMAQLDLKQLQRKEVYAQPGILLQLEDLYNQVVMQQKRMAAAEKAMNASDALLTNASALFDLDPSQGKALLEAYKRHINNRKVYLGTVLDYNLSFAQLIAKTGSNLQSFHSQFQ